MAEVMRVFRELQLDTEGGLVPARGRGRSVRPYSRVPARGGSVPLYSRRRPNFVKDDSAALGATKADRNMAVARNKDVGTFIGVTNKAAGTSMVKAASWSDFAVTKADAGNKEAAGSITGEIGVAKAEPGNKEAAGSITIEIGVAKAGPGHKEAAGGFTGEIYVTKAEMGNKEAAGTFTSEIVVTKAEVGAAWKGVTEVDWYDFVFPVNPPVGSELKADLTGAMITKERLPDCFIDRLKSRPVNTKLPPLSLSNASGVFDKFPDTRDICLDTIARWNYLVDLHVDVLRQLESKPFAEVGVDFTDGVKKIFILP